MALQDFRRGECLNWLMFKGQSNVVIYSINMVDPNGYELWIKNLPTDTDFVKQYTSLSGGGITVDATNLKVAIDVTDLEVGEYWIRFIEKSLTPPFDEFYIGKLVVEDPNYLICP